MGNKYDSGFDSMVSKVNNTSLPSDKKKYYILAKLDSVLNKYTIDKLEFDEKLISILRNLKRKRREFDATRFFVLVVGPVKSGKSTLVNIFARKYVSPTAYKECTALPTIIGKSNGDHLNKIVQYIPTTAYSDDESRKVTFDYIVDVIRGVEDKDVLNNRIIKKESELNIDNVKKIVTLYHDEEMTQDDLVVSMGIEGGGFIDNEIMLIDMPGLDGGMRHKDNTLIYSNMAQRADVVFFVQSTTSAINKDSIDFLNELFNDKKGKVPVWLIHNVHESQYFLENDAKKEADIMEQVKIGRKRVEEGFGINRFKDIVLNLGKVYAHINQSDRIKEEYRETVESEYIRYTEIEKELIKTLKAERQAIKDENNIGKAEDAISESVKIIDGCIQEINHSIKNIKNSIEAVKGVSSQLDSVEIFDSGFLSKYDELRDRISDTWTDNIRSLIQIEKGQFREQKISGKRMIEKINRVKNECLNKMPLDDGNKIRIELCNSLEHEITQQLDAKVASITKDLQNILNAPSDFEVVSDIKPLISRELRRRSYSFEFIPEYDLNIQKRCLVPIVAKKYSKEKHDEYLDETRESLLKEIPSKLTEYKKIITEDFKRIRDAYISDIKERVKKYAIKYETQENMKVAELSDRINLLNGLKNDLL